MTTSDWQPVGVPRSFSFSAASTWADCPRRWWEQRVLGKDSTSVESVRGTLMHTAAERLAAMPPAERSEEALLAHADAALVEYRDAGGEFYSPGLSRAVRERCRTLWQLENWQVIPATHIEMRLEGSSPAGRPMLGFADRVDEHAGKMIITDFKSGKSSPWSKAAAARQGAVYEYLLQQSGFDVDVTRFVYCGGGTSRTNVVLIRHSDESLADVMAWFDSACDGIAAAVERANELESVDPDVVDVAVNPSALCNYCPAGPKGDRTCRAAANVS